MTPIYAEQLSNFDKTIVVRSVSDRIDQMGGRFVKLDKQTHQWYVLKGEKKVNDVISARFRIKLKTMNRKSALSTALRRPRRQKVPQPRVAAV